MPTRILTWKSVPVEQHIPNLKHAQAILLGALPDEFWQGTPETHTVKEFSKIADLDYQVALRALQTLPADHFGVSGGHGSARTLTYLKAEPVDPAKRPFRRLRSTTRRADSQ